VSATIVVGGMRFRVVDRAWDGPTGPTLGRLRRLAAAHVPKGYEPEPDWVLAAEAVELLGGRVASRAKSRLPRNAIP